jgi:PhnB protein
MSPKTKSAPIPKGYRTITPYLLVKGAAQFIAFAQKALAAEVVRRSDGPNGIVMNAELKIGDSMLMCADPRPDMGSQPASFYLYVTDCDAWYARAIAAGAESQMKPADQFYGDRNAGVKDAFGNQWWFATHLEDLTDAEIARRAQAQKK